MSTAIELKTYKQWDNIGAWLNQKMPNPPLSEKQRWNTIIIQDGRWGIVFENERDATLFCLRWGDYLHDRH